MLPLYEGAGRDMGSCLSPAGRRRGVCRESLQNINKNSRMSEGVSQLTQSFLKARRVSLAAGLNFFKVNLVVQDPFLPPLFFLVFLLRNFPTLSELWEFF